MPVKTRELDLQKTAGEETDDALMARVAAGDRKAFACLMERYLDRTLAVSQRILCNRSDAEDMVQEAFLRVWTGAGRWRAGEAKLGTWLYRVAVNLCLDFKRRPVGQDLDAVGELVDPTPDAYATVLRQQEDTALAAAMAELPERQRMALSLCYSGELSNAEAAGVLAISVGALEALLVRARRSLRERLRGTAS